MIIDCSNCTQSNIFASNTFLQGRCFPTRATLFIQALDCWGQKPRWAFALLLWAEVLRCVFACNFDGTTLLQDKIATIHRQGTFTPCRFLKSGIIAHQATGCKPPADGIGSYYPRALWSGLKFQAVCGLPPLSFKWSVVTVLLFLFVCYKCICSNGRF